MSFLDDLNPEQRAAVLQVDGPLLILAGAGSGKTRVIAYRVAHLIGSGHASPGEMMAVTFTNKAADEMRERVERLIGSACSGAWISTFHSMCARILRREAAHAGLPRDFVIYDTDDQRTVMKRVLKDLRIDETLLQPAQALSPDQQREEPDEGPGGLRRHGVQPVRPAHARGLRELRGLARGKPRPRLRRPAAAHRRALRRCRGVPTPLLESVQLRPGRRVPGHQPAAVPS